MLIGNDSDLDSEFVCCLRTIVGSSDPDDVKRAWNNLEEMENAECGGKNSTYDCNRNYDKFLRSILTEMQVRNVGEISRLLNWFSRFPFPTSSSNPISDDIAQFLTDSAEAFKDDPCLADILQAIQDNHYKYLPSHNNHKNLCKAIVVVLSYMNSPEKKMQTNNEDLIQLTSYIQTLIQIKNFLMKICQFQCQDTNMALVCFNKMCEILLKGNRSEDPSSALVIVLQIVDEQLWKQYMDMAVKEIYKEVPDDRKIVKMLSLFCHWLCQPPFTHTEYLSMWITLFIRGLEKMKKQGIPREVAENVLPTIFCKCVEIEKFYLIPIEYNIVLYLLMKVGSLDLYHTMIEMIIPFLKKSERVANYQNGQEIVGSIIKTTWTLRSRFSQHLNTKPCDKCEIFHLVQGDYRSRISEENEEMEVSYPSTSTGQGRYEGVKVGLTNLGNTCYMNSVLQALAMTRQFCREVLLYKTSDLADQSVLKNLQNLFALLKYCNRTTLSPIEIFHASRPSYFLPGQQQDSSEFLCHLLDVLYEQQKSVLGNSDQSIKKSKVEDKEMADIEEITGASDSPLNDDGAAPNMVRWTTEENLSEGASLQRKTQSLADFTQGEELAQTQNGLSDSHSDSTDSGIQSVGGEDSSSSSATSSGAASPSDACSYLVHRVFGGELKVIYQCVQCGNESHNTDKFRDLQLCFLEALEPSDPIKVQDLINANYFQPEKLTGDNMYKCEKCAKLCEAQRIIKILQAPAHLILTLKHFRYNMENGLRTKLRRKVIYDHTIQLPVFDHPNETYDLYAAVVHSGYSLDYGHYLTYACDAQNHWYKFNDSYVSESTLEDFKRLEPPDTPYILFYKKRTELADEEDKPDFSLLSKELQEYIEEDKRNYQLESKKQRPVIAGPVSRHNANRSWDRDDDDDDSGGGGGRRLGPPSNCADHVNIPTQQCLY